MADGKAGGEILTAEHAEHAENAKKGTFLTTKYTNHTKIGLTTDGRGLKAETRIEDGGWQRPEGRFLTAEHAEHAENAKKGTFVTTKYTNHTKIGLTAESLQTAKHGWNIEQPSNQGTQGEF